MSRKLLLLLLLSLTPTFVLGQVSDNGLPVKVITDGDIVGTYNFSNDTVYNLSGFVFVDSGEIINIEAGTIFKANPGQGENASALIVSRWGQIFATGTANQPIIFTSIQDDLDLTNDIPAGDNGRGLWGGVIILGSADINTTDSIGYIEGLPETNRSKYGHATPDNSNSSGVLQYVSIRHGGSVIGAANEINGLTMGGVGSGTVIEHIEVFQNLDDGYEWFGGTVNVKWLVAAFCGDDAFDVDEGWSGAAQFLFSIQDGIDGDQGGEHDGGTSPEDGLPYATPLFSNATYLGSGLLPINLGKNPGCFNIRDNCAPAYYNSIFSDHAGIAVKIEDLSSGQDSRARLEAGDLVFENNVWGRFLVGTSPFAMANNQTWTAELFTNGSFGNDISDPEIFVTRTATADNDPRPKAAGLPAWTDPTVYNPPAKPGQGATFAGFFDNVSYVGAFDPAASIANLWIAGWTAFDYYGYLGENTGGAGCVLTDNAKPVKVITDADIVGQYRFSRDTVYNLSGFVFVDSGEAIGIEPGTIFKANPGQGENASALIVSRWGQILAPGEATCPIIFTSIQDDIDFTNDIAQGDNGRGLWGGVILLGPATINTTDSIGYIEGLPETNRSKYGHATPEDKNSSGVLQYVSIRHGGSIIGAANEINGLTMGAVGSGTVIEHIEVFQNLDDGYEWFGGTVNVKWLVAAFCGDDAFDVDEGWSGAAQFLFSIQDGIDGDQGGEHDGGTSPEDGLPYATPLFSNATYLGAGLTPAVPGKNPSCFNIRDNCAPAYYNSIFSDHAGCAIKIEDVVGADTSDSYDRLQDGDLVFQNNIWGNFASGTSSNDLACGQSWTETLFTTGAFSNVQEDPLICVSRDSLMDNDPRPKATLSVSWTDPTVYNPPAKPGQGAKFAGFFDNVNYIGAFDPSAAVADLWIADWTAFDTYKYLGTNDACAATGCCGEFDPSHLTGNWTRDPGNVKDLSDILGMASYAFLGGSSNGCLWEGNVDGDAGCVVDLSDILGLASFAFLGGADPTACDDAWPCPTL